MVGTRVVLLASASLLVLLSTPGRISAGAAETRLAITVYPQGIGRQPVQRYTLRCGPAAGTVPRPVRACSVLARLQDPFSPTPPGTNCTDLALGPEEATVTGWVRSRSVSAHLSVRGGCEIERWRRVADVVPGFPGRR
jgi:hypothetical protein